MSLINDALRKAQKQRTGEAVPLAALPSVGGETAARIHKRGKPAGFYTLLLRLGLGAGGLAVLVIGGCILLRSEKKPTEVATAPQVAAVSTPAPASPSPVTKPLDEPRRSLLASPKPGEGGQSEGGPPPATSFTLPLAASSSPGAKPQDAPRRSSLASPKPGEGGQPSASPLATPQVSGLRSQVSEPAPPVQPPPAAPPPKMEGRAINYIENLRIAGIRASATDAKVLMNDRVYRINDIVEHELNLKLVGITSSSLTFENEHGARYTRSF